MKYRADNPCDRLTPVLGPQQARVRHMRALPHCEVAAALAAVRGLGGPARRHAGVRVFGAHRGTVGGGARGPVGRDRHRRAGVDYSGPADEEPPRAPRAVVRAGAGDPRRGTDTW